MTDMCIEYRKKRKVEFYESIKNQNREREAKAEITCCDNCGKKPAYPMKVDGMYDSFMIGFKANLCKGCNKKLNEWYFPEEEYR